MTLSILWFVLIAVLWTAYLVAEGFDFGVGAPLPFVVKNDEERTQAMRAIGPHWDGNEVWLLTAGGATLAAFPEWYAMVFSGMYLPLFLILFVLIIRISALEWRSKIATVAWRARWDMLHTFTVWLVPILLGVAFANFVQGMKIEVMDIKSGEIIAPNAAADSLATATHQFTGGFFSLLTPFMILGGVAILLVCLVHGAQLLALKTEGDVHERANGIAAPLTVIAALVAAVFLLWGQFVCTTNILAWTPLLVTALVIIASTAFSQKAMRREGVSFTLSALAIAGAVAWVFASMAPAVQKSSTNPAYLPTIEQASSSASTLQVMAIVALCLTPVVLAYTAWSYWTFRKRVSVSDVDHNTGLLLDKIRLGESFLAG